jgi:hypothetical protein
MTNTSSTPSSPPLATRIANSLAQVGFSLHRCEPDDTGHGLGGICLLTVEAMPDLHPAGIVVSWTPHCLLLLDERQREPFFAALHTLNSALGSVLKAFGYDAEPYRSSSAWIVLAAPRRPLNSAQANRPAPAVHLQAGRTPCRPAPKPPARCRTTAPLHSSSPSAIPPDCRNS